MKAQVRLDDCLLDEIDVENGLREGCCMAPVLFNLYSCAAIERWKGELEGEEGTGIYLRYKHDKKLFRRYTRNALTTRLTECQFADDAALLATSRGYNPFLANLHKGGNEFWSVCQHSKNKAHGNRQSGRGRR